MTAPSFPDDDAAISDYLTPVFLKKEVLVQYLFDPSYRCVFCSETYGTIYGEDWDLQFGINPAGKVVAWRGDIETLPVSEQYFLHSKLSASDGNIDSEFKEAQLEAKFTKPVEAVRIYLGMNRLATRLKSQFEHEILHVDAAAVDDVLQLCSRHKRIIFGDRDQLKAVVGELHELAVEGFRESGLKKTLDEGQLDYESKWGALKLFEKLVHARDGSVSLSPFFYLNDLRIWARHRGESKWETGTNGLGLDRDSSAQEVYDTLVAQLAKSVEAVFEVFVSTPES